jgi:hypothetical protein
MLLILGEILQIDGNIIRWTFIDRTVALEFASRKMGRVHDEHTVSEQIKTLYPTYGYLR